MIRIKARPTLKPSSTGRSGREAKLSYLGHALMENRNGLAVGGMVTPADGTAERRASEALLEKQAKGSKRITVGEDKAYDTSDHIAALRRMNVTPHVAQNDSLTKTGKRRSSAIDARTTRHIGYQISQTCRKMAECIFGWGKQHGTMRKTKHRGIAAVSANFMLNLIAYDLASHSQAHRRLRRSLPANQKAGSDRQKIQQQRKETAWLPQVFQQTDRSFDRELRHCSPKRCDARARQGASAIGLRNAVALVIRPEFSTSDF